MSPLHRWSTFAGFLFLPALAPAVALGQAPTFLLSWGHVGAGPGEFAAPRGIASDADGNVFVTDSGAGPTNRVQKFSNTGVFIGQ